MIRESLHIISEKLKVIANSIVMLGADFNVGHFDTRGVHQKPLEIIEDNELTQHKMEPTRLGTILVLFLNY